MDDSRVLVAGGVGKRKKSRKNPQPKPSLSASQHTGPPQPVQEPDPIQQVPHHQEPDDMMIDNPFGSEQMQFFTEQFQAAQDTILGANQVNPANLAGQIERITLEDPVHEIMEIAGSSVSQVWSTSAYFNNFPLPTMPIGRAEECVALTTLKMGLYSLQLREARLAKERDLIIAQTFAE
ncbi:unnamed protein product [Cuscuta europaea]|uniref:Uncharacterized protein n=1 Tax=Cuscuta europaea TaxID=41803 RepID=A0A9P1E6R3_CUSEU|nr:unnamed protein product [Cuscuta europaea]